MSLLVTGGAGFIGSNFVRKFAGSEKIVILDALTYAGNLASLMGIDYEFVHGDICDADLVEKVLSTHRIKRIVHFAAESHVDRSILGPEAFVKTNVLGSMNLLYRAKEARIEKFVHVSTDEVYGDLGPDDAPFTESTPISPRSPYSASKAGSDLLAKAWWETYKFPVTITRCSNNYGPYQFPEKLIPLMILNAMADKPLPVYGDGKNVRDWIHVEDHCDAIKRVLDDGKPGEVYNIGGRSERTNIEIVHAILKALDKPETLIKYVTDRPGHDRRYAIDDSKIERELGWTRSKRLEESLIDTVNWYKTNDAWIRGIKTGTYRQWIDRNYAGRL